MPEPYIPGQQVWVYLKVTNHDAVDASTNPEGLVDVDTGTLSIQADAPNGSVSTLSDIEHVSLGLYRVRLRLSVPGGPYTIRSVSPSGLGDTVGETVVEVGRSPFVP